MKFFGLCCCKLRVVLMTATVIPILVVTVVNSGQIEMGFVVCCLGHLQNMGNKIDSLSHCWWFHHLVMNTCTVDVYGTCCTVWTVVSFGRKRNSFLVDSNS